MSYRIDQEDFESFFECPFRCYGSDTLYVSLLKSDFKRILDKQANPVFKKDMALTYFTLFAGDEIVGRITAHEHIASNTKFGLKKAYFGHFDCANDPEAAGMLLNAAETWARQRGLTEIEGNYNLTAMQQMGVMTEGFANTPYTDQTWSPPYLPSLLETHGYQKHFPMSTWEVNLDQVEGKDANASGLRLETISRKKFRQQIDAACQVLNAGFANNPYFVPLSAEEFWFHSKEMIWIMDQKISLLAYDQIEPVGVVVCIPDLNPFLKATRSRLTWTTPYHFIKNRFKRDRAVIIFYSVAPKAQGQGLNTRMLHQVISNLKTRGYKSLGITWIGDVNPGSLRQVEKLQATRLHRLHLFRKEL